MLPGVALSKKVSTYKIDLLTPSLLKVFLFGGVRGAHTFKHHLWAKQDKRKGLKTIFLTYQLHLKS